MRFIPTLYVVALPGATTSADDDTARTADVMNPNHHLSDCVENPVFALALAESYFPSGKPHLAAYVTLTPW
jgi:hypothetical protein